MMDYEKLYNQAMKDMEQIHTILSEVVEQSLDGDVTIYEIARIQPLKITVEYQRYDRSMRLRTSP